MRYNNFIAFTCFVLFGSTLVQAAQLQIKQGDTHVIHDFTYTIPDHASRNCPRGVTFPEQSPENVQCNSDNVAHKGWTFEFNKNTGDGTLHVSSDSPLGTFTGCKVNAMCHSDASAPMTISSQFPEDIEISKLD